MSPVLGTLRHLGRRLRRRSIATPSRTSAEWAAIGRALAAHDARTIAAQRTLDATRRRVALITGTTLADGARRLTPMDAMVAVPRLVERTVSFVVAELADTIVPGKRRAGERGLGSPFLALLLAVVVGAPNVALAQDVKIRDLTIAEGAAPIRLVGYGLAVGLDGTGDRATGSRGSGMTVTSVVNLLRRFDVEIPAEMLRTRNVAAVLVTAEVSPYLRSGGRFDVHVSSLGDARSLRGGVLWMTPLVAEAGGKPLAAAQGALMLSEAADPRDRYAAPTVETTARMPSGGQLESDLPRPSFAGASRLLLKEPDVGTASRIAASINSALGSRIATVEDPGAVALALPDTGDRAVLLTRVRELAVRPDRAARIIIDGRDGTVVAGGDLTIGEAVVSHGAVTLTIESRPATQAAGDTSSVPGDVRVAPGTSVQKVATALHAMQTPAPEIAAIFLALREVGALSAEVIIR